MTWHAKMSVLVAIRGWRVSVINASTRRTRWTHRIERISRPAGLSLLRESSTSTIRAGTLEREEAKPSQPDGPPESEPNEPPLLETAEPEQSMKSLTAVERQVVVKMRKKDYSRLRIAQFLGRHLQVVHDALYQLGPIDPNRNKLPGLRFSDSELEKIESLRWGGTPWKTIRLQVAPDFSIAAILKRFTVQMKAIGKQVPVTGPLLLSSADLQEIAQLRQVGKSWAQIAKLKFNKRTSPRSASKETVQFAYLRQTSQIWKQKHHILQFTTSGLRNITRLRESKKFTWLQIAERLCPGYDANTVSHKFYLKMLEEDLDPKFQDPNADAAARLGEEMKSWLQIMKSKYPRLHLRTICEQVLQEPWELDGKGVSLDNRPRGLKMSEADLQDISRLREEGKNWDEITELKYRGCKTDTVLKMFYRSTRGTEAMKRARKPLDFTAADLLDIARLREERKTWHEIGALKSPGWSIEHFRRMVLKCKRKHERRIDGDDGDGDGDGNFKVGKRRVF